MAKKNPVLRIASAQELFNAARPGRCPVRVLYLDNTAGLPERQAASELRLIARQLSEVIHTPAIARELQACGYASRLSTRTVQTLNDAASLLESSRDKV